MTTTNANTQSELNSVIHEAVAGINRVRASAGKRARRGMSVATSKASNFTNPFTFGDISLRHIAIQLVDNELLRATACFLNNATGEKWYHTTENYIDCLSSLSDFGGTGGYTADGDYLQAKMLTEHFANINTLVEKLQANKLIILHPEIGPAGFTGGIVTLTA